VKIGKSDVYLILLGTYAFRKIGKRKATLFLVVIN